MMPGAPTISVLIADANRMFCQLVSRELKRSRYHFSVAACAIDSVGVRRALGERQPHVATISANLQDGPLAGFELLHELRTSHSKVAVIMLLDSLERDLVVDCFRGGARGIFCRDEPFEGLCKCIYSVYRGQIWANSKELRYALDTLAETAPLRLVNAKGARLLTKRQEDVVGLVAEGMTNREVSHQLNLSEHTVRNYLFRIFEKLGISSRVELVLYALNQKESAKTQAVGEG
jgi:DNA-binding NarL/FixJ family response regulator